MSLSGTNVWSHERYLCKTRVTLAGEREDIGQFWVGG